MNTSYKAWATWSIVIFIVWGLVFLIVWKLKGLPALKALSLVLAGYFIGWISATIKFVLIVRKIPR